MRAELKAGLAVAGLVLVLALAFQGSRGLWEPDEGRNANIAFSMLRSGDWLVPRLNGDPYLDKPPVHFWTVAAGMAILGADEWGARLFQGLLFAATAGLVGALGSRLWDRATGRLAALAYATSLLPFMAGNILTPDMPLAACGAAVLYAYWRAHGAETAPRALERSAWWLAVGLVVGIGLLTKGPAMLVLLPPLFVHLVVRRRVGAALLSPGLWLGGLAAVGLALAWYVPIAERFPGAAAYFLDNQVVGRIATDTYRRNPGWMGALEIYVPTLIAGSLPWSAWWLLAGRRLLVRPDGGWWRRIWTSPRLLLLALCVCLPLAVYLAASSRLHLYALPIFAPLALATGRGLRLAGAAAWDRRRAVGLAVWCLALLAVKLVAAQSERGRDSRAVAKRIAAEAPSAPFDILALDHANGLPVYGYDRFRWVTVEKDPYPLFTPLQSLAEAVPSLVASGRTQVVLVTSKKRDDALFILNAAGFSCDPRRPAGRMNILVCRPPGG